MVAMTSSWRWADSSEYFDWISTCGYRISLEADVSLVFVFGIQVSTFLGSELEYFGLQRLDKNTLKASCESNGDSPRNCERPSLVNHLIRQPLQLHNSHVIRGFSNSQVVLASCVCGFDLEKRSEKLVAPTAT